MTETELQMLLGKAAETIGRLTLDGLHFQNQLDLQGQQLVALTGQLADVQKERDDLVAERARLIATVHKYEPPAEVVGLTPLRPPFDQTFTPPQEPS